MAAFIYEGRNERLGRMEKKRGQCIEDNNESSRWHDEIAMKAGLLSFEVLRLDT